MDNRVSQEHRSRLARLMSMSWRDLFVIALPLLLVLAAGTWAAFKFVRLTPPRHIRMVAGAKDTSSWRQAEKYRAILKKERVELELVPTRGSLENLLALADKNSKVDLAFVQGGLKDFDKKDDVRKSPDEEEKEDPRWSKLRSLGSVSEQPLYVYYRHTEVIETLAQLKGLRVAVGPEGSGTRVLALKLLRASGIRPGDVHLHDVGGAEAAEQLVAGEIDVAFLMGESASREVQRKMRRAEGVRLMSFRQADAYVRRMPFLQRLIVPEGLLDLEANYPLAELKMVAPNVELVTREDLHPALSDLLIQTAKKVHGEAGRFREAGEFPTLARHDFKVSEDAERYYKSGSGFLLDKVWKMPFWIASLVDRLVKYVLPFLLLLLPALRIAPTLYRWRVRSRIYRWYGVLMALEREMRESPTADQRESILKRLGDIQVAVVQLRLPAAYADQLYVLRDHVAAVRRRLLDASAATPSAGDPTAA